MQNAGEAVQLATKLFTEAGLETPRLDARVLVAAALNIDKTRLFSHPEQPISDHQCLAVHGFIQRRLGREPVARIVGEREFWSLTFKVDASTLVPRPDSETLVEAILKRTDNRAGRISILDMGTGSGCLVLALLSELSRATAVGVDISARTLDIATQNARFLGLDQRVRFLRSNWCDGLAADARGPFDIIISNPPYIAVGDLKKLDPDVAEFDPHGALSGGDDGLQAYRELLPGLSRYLAKTGIAGLEIGWDQAGAVKNIADQAGLSCLETVQDMAGRDRVLLFRPVES